MVFVNEDNRTFLQKLDDRSVDLFILDPPYYKVVNEKWDTAWKTFEEYRTWFDNLMINIEAKAKHSCSLWLFGFPYQLTKLIDVVEKHGFTYRQQIVLDKGLRSVAGRVSSKLKMFPCASESIFFFYKESRSVVRTMLNEKKIEKNLSSEEINKHLGKASNGGGTWSSIAGLKKSTFDLQYPTKEVWNDLETLLGPLGKYNDFVYKFNVKFGLTDVWKDINWYDRSILKVHPTQKPMDLITRLIETSTVEGDLIVDSFGGSGVTYFLATKLGRRCESCELDETYHKLATEAMTTEYRR
jgi:DNA modification methylase